MKAAVLRGLTIAVLVIVSGCTTVSNDSGDPPQRAEPGWLLNPPSSSDVIYGVGGSAINDNKARALQSARTAATVNLMANLRVTIRAEQQSSSRINSEGDISETFSQDITSVIPELELNDTRLVDTWESPDGQLYALVSYDRAAAASRVGNEFRQKRGNLLPPESASDALWQTYERWEQTLSRAEELNALYELYTLLTSGERLTAEWPATVNGLTEAYNGFLEQIVLMVEPGDEASGEFDSLAREYFSGLGPAIIHAMAPPNSQPVWTLRYRVESDHRTQGDRHYQFVTVSASLLDENNEERRQASITRRGISTSEAEARRRGADEAFSAVAGQLIR